MSSQAVQSARASSHHTVTAPGPVKVSTRAEVGHKSTDGEFEHSAGPVHALIEHLATYSYPIAAVPILLLAAGEYEGKNGYLFYLLLPLAWLSGDFITGMVHWCFDTYGTTEAKVVGQAFVKPFREHHTDPKGITRHSLAVTIGNTCIVATPMSFAVLYPLLFSNPSDGYRTFAFYFSVTISATVLTNQFHKWAHLEKIPGWINALQRVHLILNPVHHEVHHTRPHDTYYCITNGWMDPILHRMNFWRGMEKMLSWVGARPSHTVMEERKIR